MHKLLLPVLISVRLFASANCDSLSVLLDDNLVRDSTYLPHLHRFFQGYMHENEASSVFQCTRMLLERSDSLHHPLSYAVIVELHGLSSLNDNQQKLAGDCFARSLELARKESLTDLEMSNYLNLARTYSLSGMFDEARLMAETFIAKAGQTGIAEKQAEGYTILARIYDYQGNYLKAFSAYDRSRDINQRAGNLSRLIWDYANIARNFLHRDNYEEALEYYTRSLEVSALLNFPSGNIRHYMEDDQFPGECYKGPYPADKSGLLSACYHDPASMEQETQTYMIEGFLSYRHGKFWALEFFEKKLKEAREKGDELKEVDCMLDIAMVYNDLGNYTEALNRYEAALIIADKIGYKRGITECYKNIGDIKIKQENFDDALKWCEQAYNLSDEMGLLVLEKQASACLYQANKSLGDGIKALDYYKVYTMLDMTILQDSSNNEQLKLAEKNRWVIDSIAMEKDKLKDQLEYQNSLYKAKNTRNIFMFVGIGIFLLSGGLFSRIRYIRRTNRELEEKSRIIAREKEKAEESKRVKELFFANVSHEFRTPLTLIRGPIKNIFQHVDDSGVKDELKIIERNAARLQALVDQLLNLSKIDSGKMKLKVIHADVVKTVQLFMQSFEPIARLRKVEYKFEPEEDQCLIYFDRVMIEQVVGNILSNAFKYVNEGGCVSVSIKNVYDPQLMKKGVKVTVSDTGPGIPSEWQERIFDRFSQVEGTQRIGLEGSGIGLALSRELVNLHRGRIWLEDNSGPGSTFSFFLPAGKDHFLETDLYGEDLSAQDIETAHILAPQSFSRFIKGEFIKPIREKNASVNPDQPVLLIVEDNPDMVMYIKSFFIDHYQVVSAEDGIIGLERAFELIPDIIISDLMMPDMDGNELCKKIKEDIRTSHIPVILLTAQAGIESKLKGLETGADDFMVKPFDADELVIRVKNLVHRRQKLMEVLHHRLGLPGALLPPGTVAAGLISMDEKFLSKLMGILEEHYTNPDFSVSELSEKMNMHRVQLHRKLKALTGQTASDLIREIRLKKAAQMLAAKAGHVSQVAFDVGFSNLSYFAKAFKEQFSMSPSEYLKKVTLNA